MGRIKDTAYRRKKKSRPKPRKVNYDLEQRRRQKERQSRRRQRRASSSWKEKLRIVLSHVPAVGRWVIMILAVCLLAFSYVWLFGQKVSTVGDSMKPVLENGDVVMVDRVIYNATAPKRGHVIVFRPKGNKNSHYYIKRIIGLPGETVSIVENSIFIDGEKLEEEYTTTEIGDAGLAADEIQLGDNEYFVLGDDRENSEDSRHADVGIVKRSYIYGKAWFISAPGKHMGFVK